MSLPEGYHTTFDLTTLPSTKPTTEEPTPARRAVAVPASSIQRERVEWLEPGRVPLRMVTVLAGVGGLGKSQLACLIAARNPGVTLLATAEDSPSTTVVPRLQALEADMGRVRFVSIKTQEGLEDGITIPDDLEELERLVALSQARLLIVDPLVAHLPTSIDSHKDQSVRRALAPLYRLAENQNCAVITLVHLNKAQGLAPLMRLGGSGAFGNAARSVLLLDRDPDDPDGEEGNQRVLAHIKCNVAALAPSLVYAVTPTVLPATADDPEVETSRLELIGESPHNGRALLESASEEERLGRDDADEFLQTELEDGERHSAEELFKAARRVGINDRTLRRSRKRIGAKTEKAGFSAGWEWWLPKGTSAQTADSVPLAKNVMDSEVAPQSEDGRGQPPRLAPSGGLSPSPFPGDDDFLDYIGTAHRAGHVTTAEALERERHHELVLRVREAVASG